MSENPAQVGYQSSEASLYKLYFQVRGLLEGQRELMTTTDDA